MPSSASRVVRCWFRVVLSFLAEVSGAVRAVRGAEVPRPQGFAVLVTDGAALLPELGNAAEASCLMCLLLLFCHLQGLNPPGF